jgi:hypothetical protein
MMLNRRDFSAVLLAGAAASMILISGHISDIAYWHIASVCCGTGPSRILAKPAPIKLDL